MDRQKKYSKERVTVHKRILNALTTFKLLGINFCVHLEKCEKFNFPEKVSDIKETINKWNRRYLTPLGKITVIKTLLMSKLNHAFSAPPDPEDKLIKEINDIFFQFIWSNKPAKINREVVTLDKTSGGLNMIHLKHFITSLKVTWIRRLILSDYKPLWMTLFEKIFHTDANKFILYGSQCKAYLKRKTNSS